MRNKIMVTAMLAMIVAMTGIAAADQINIYEQSTTTDVVSIGLLPGGAAVTKDLKITAFTLPLMGPYVSPIPHTITNNVIVAYNPGGATTSDIVIKYKEVGNSLAPAPYTWNQTSGRGGSEILDVEFSAIASAPTGAMYSIQITDDNGVTQTISVQLIATSIPEFPTVALPVGAVLGLVFFFQHKKRKEE